jgi:hypothetical protein
MTDVEERYYPSAGMPHGTCSWLGEYTESFIYTKTERFVRNSWLVNNLGSDITSCTLFARTYEEHVFWPTLVSCLQFSCSAVAFH